MIKLGKFYILAACTALCIFGCDKTEVAPETEKVPVAEIEQPEKSQSEETDIPDEEEETQYYPIKKGAEFRAFFIVK